MDTAVSPTSTRARTPAEDPHALLRLLLAGGAAAPRRRLLATHGSATAAIAAGADAWHAAGLDAGQHAALHRAGGAEMTAATAWLARPGHHLIGCNDPDYPPLLRDAPGAPLGLFIAGDPSLLWHPMVAVVGSRNPSAAGREHATAFSHAFVRAGLGIASGLALGIDACAHTAALEAGAPTIAVLGCGPDIAYPGANAPLQARIAGQGAVVSEFPPGTRPLREHFPARNRIVAALSLGTLVVEAALRSGALITARLAAEAGREVFAIPGSLHNPMARGCHRLIREGAALVESPEEVIGALDPIAQVLAHALHGRLHGPTSCAEPPSAAPGVDPEREDPDYNRLWAALGHDPTDMDRLASRTGLTMAEVSSMLLLMELEGRVLVEHGRYSRISATKRPRGAGRGK
ncbi:DNA-protecting protein DprA [Luteimonas yindakuii]|uniref:DNA-processing protein DprA n=1 Tax=Luteimonas yindakuii TaxID=2565782 RepID=UPI001107785B|nr:DNA-processing protein DprA [Luteimonas yindakuii]QCU72349.1 DNA-protecting protein DprA [Luteimonas yindakuii]